jgi:adenylate cyclase
LRVAGVLEPLEVATYDRLLRLRTPIAAADSEVVLVQIREDDIRRFGHPLCDDLLARSIALLLDAGASTVGVDLYRDVPIDRACDPWDGPTRSLERAVNATDRVVMVSKFALDDSARVPAPPWLASADRAGFSDIPVDAGGKVRRGLLFQWDGDVAHVSFALQLALRHLRDRELTLVADPDDPNLVRLGTTTIPAIDARFGGYARSSFGGYQYLLDYRGGPHPFPSVSLGELLADPSARARVRDKIAILGTTSPSVKDFFYTPFSTDTTEDQAMYGIEVHAHAVDQLLRFSRDEARGISSWNEPLELAWTFAWSLLAAAIGALFHRGPTPGLAAGLAALGVQGWAGTAALSQGLWIPVVPPVLAALGSLGLSVGYVAAVQRRERTQVVRLFSRFLRPAVAQRIWSQRAAFIGDSGRPRSQWSSLTVLMADLQGYTTISEEADPYVLMGWVNEFLATMARQVEAHSGVVDDYSGDGLKADFGFPAPVHDEGEARVQARNAVRCALAMGEAMERLNEQWAERQLPSGRVRIGIVTGPAVVGVIGGGDSLKYTSVGDTVNTAARLEAFEKEGYRLEPEEPCWRILIGDETRSYIGDEIDVIDLGEFALTGKSEKVRIHRVRGARRHDEEASG